MIKQFSHVIGAGLFLALQAFPSALRAKEVKMPEFAGITQWLNSPPLTKESLKGKVVLVDFWTYSCINCIRSLPHVVEWHKKYEKSGLVIVGVHAPEFAFEKNADNVKKAVAQHGITYPVALDNDHATWRAYANRYWPAHYLMDRHGILRYRHFGEGNYAETENMIRTLLAEGGSLPAEAPSLKNQTDFAKIKTPEIYLGYERLAALANAEKIQPGKRQAFKEPKSLPPHRFSLAGEWRVAAEYAAAEGAPAAIAIVYEAQKANMVMDTAQGQEVEAEVLIDGRPATAENKGTDVILENGRAICPIKSARLYNLSKTEGGGTHRLELRFSKPGARVYTYTFG